MNRTRTTLALCAAIALAAALPALAGDEKPAAPQGSMTPEMMEAMQKLATPGEHHKHLAHMVGTWKSHGKMWMMPGEAPTETDGTMKVTPVLGGRFFQSEFKGNFMGQEFQGLGMDGYDNAKGKHIGTWMDSMGTMMMVFEGTCSDGGKVTTTTSDFTDPASGMKMQMKGVTTEKDANTVVFESFMKMPDGQEFKSMEITYTRM